MPWVLKRDSMAMYVQRKSTNNLEIFRDYGPQISVFSLSSWNSKIVECLCMKFGRGPSFHINSQIASPRGYRNLLVTDSSGDIGKV